MKYVIVMLFLMLTGCYDGYNNGQSSRKAWESFLYVCDYRTIVVAMSQQEGVKNFSATCKVPKE